MLILIIDERQDMHKQLIQHLELTIARTKARLAVLEHQLASAQELQAAHDKTTLPLLKDPVKK